MDSRPLPAGATPQIGNRTIESLVSRARKPRTSDCHAQLGQEDGAVMCAAPYRPCSCDRWIIMVVGPPLSTKGVDFMRSKTNSAGSKGALNGTWRSVLLSLVLAGGISSGSALARSIVIEIAPPPPQVEVVPVMRHGYTWAPGYWAWRREACVGQRSHDAGAQRISMGARPLESGRRPSRVPGRSLDARVRASRAIT